MVLEYCFFLAPIESIKYFHQKLTADGREKNLSDMKKTWLLLLLVPALMACDGKKKPDPETYAALCQEVVQCDPLVKAQPNGEDLCKRSMAVLEEKFPAKVPEMESCIKAQPCEEKNIATCMTKVAQGVVP